MVVTSASSWQTLTSKKHICVYVIRTNKMQIVTLMFNLIILSSTCFKHPSIHPQEDLCMQFYGISFMHPHKQSGR